MTVLDPNCSYAHSQQSIHAQLDCSFFPTYCFSIYCYNFIYFHSFPSTPIYKYHNLKQKLLLNTTRTRILDTKTRYPDLAGEET